MHRETDIRYAIFPDKPERGGNVTHGMKTERDPDVHDEIGPVMAVLKPVGSVSESHLRNEARECQTAARAGETENGVQPAISDRLF